MISHASQTNHLISREMKNFVHNHLPGTHLKIFIEVSPIVTHFFSLVRNTVNIVIIIMVLEELAKLEHPLSIINNIINITKYNIVFVS